MKPSAGWGSRCRTRCDSSALHFIRRSQKTSSEVFIWPETSSQAIRRIASQTFHQASSLYSPPPKGGGTAANIIIKRAHFPLQCIHPHPSSSTSRGHSTSKTHSKGIFHHHHNGSKFSCFINLHWFYCGSLLQFIHCPTVSPVVPNVSLKSIYPRYSKKWKLNITHESKKKEKI